MNNIEHIIHFNGNPYILEWKKSKYEEVKINENKIIFKCLKYDQQLFRTLLRRFFKNEVEKELTKLMYDAQNDFKEIEFPTIKVGYMVNRHGYYRKKDNFIKLSSNLARYDFKFIKVVLYHELSHVFQFNHSPAFYTVFESKYLEGPALDRIYNTIKYNDYI